MKKTISLLLALLLAVCCGGCGGGPTETSPVSSEPETTDAAVSEAETTEPETTVPETTAFVSETDADGYHSVLMSGTVFWVRDGLVKEPYSELDIGSMSFADFGDTFTETYPVTVDSYMLRKNTSFATAVTHIKAAEAGPVIYIVAGIHGDERAGWYAGTLLKSLTIRSGEVYLISCANTLGAKNGTRMVTKSQNLNRVFPGHTKNEAGLLAKEIFEDIRAKQPELLLDLHEAIAYSESETCLGSTLITSNEELAGELFWSLFFATEEGEICFEPFGTDGPGPDGSINRTVTEQLGIPSITVETFRGYEIEHRVEEQLEIVEYVLQQKGMR